MTPSQPTNKLHLASPKPVRPQGENKPSRQATFKMPTEKQMDAFRRGDEAFSRESEMCDNPYPEDSDLYDFWGYGWMSGKYPSPKSSGLPVSDMNHQPKAGGE